MDEKLHLQWRGRPVGPWTYEQVQTALQSGEIHSMYQIQSGGEWQPLREYVERREAANLEKRAAEMIAARVEQQRAAEKSKVQTRKLRAGGVHAPAFPDPPPPLIKGAHSLALRDAEPETRTSWLAVACLVMSMCNFIPYLNTASWFVSLVFGHLALVQMKNDDTLDGRALAIAGMIVSYAVVIFAIVAAFFLPAALARVFPIFE